jgi:hypothetical protein
VYDRVVSFLLQDPFWRGDFLGDYIQTSHVAALILAWNELHDTTLLMFTTPKSHLIILYGKSSWISRVILYQAYQMVYVFVKHETSPQLSSFVIPHHQKRLFHECRFCSFDTCNPLVLLPIFVINHTTTNAGYIRNSLQRDWITLDIIYRTLPHS